jgi:hypothetical protein
VDLTGGEVHHLLALRGDQLVVWQGLSPTQAYSKVAQALCADPRLAKFGVTLDKVGDKEGDALREMKRTRLNIQVPSVLREQLDSVLPFLSGPEKYRAAFETTASHVSAAGSQETTQRRGEILAGVRVGAGGRAEPADRYALGRACLAESQPLRASTVQVCTAFVGTSLEVQFTVS